MSKLCPCGKVPWEREESIYQTFINKGYDEDAARDTAEMYGCTKDNPKHFGINHVSLEYSGIYDGALGVSCDACNKVFYNASRIFPETMKIFSAALEKDNIIPLQSIPSVRIALCALEKDTEQALSFAAKVLEKHPSPWEGWQFMINSLVDDRIKYVMVPLLKTPLYDDSMPEIKSTMSSMLMTMNEKVSIPCYNAMEWHISTVLEKNDTLLDVLFDIGYYNEVMEPEVENK